MIKKTWKTFISLVLVTCLIVITNSLAYSQTSAAPENKLDGAPVVFNNETLFVIQENIGPIPYQQRAEGMSERIEKFAKDFSVPVDSLQVIDDKETIVLNEAIAYIATSDQLLVAITDADARAAGTTRQKLATEYLQKIKASIGQYRKERSLTKLIFGVLYTVIATVSLVILFTILNKIFPRIYTQLHAWRDTRIRPLRIQNFELISAHQIVRFSIQVSHIIRWLLTFGIFVIYIALVLSFFPWTKRLGRDIFNEFLKAINFVWDKFVGYLPNLLIIALIILITYYLIRLLKLIFNAIGREDFSLPGFYPEWAEPTFKLLSLLVIAMAVVIVFPYLPGSDSPAFRGISIFLGVLFSLGSTAAIANIVSGIILIYTRAFEIGDLVNVADTLGFVEEKLLLVTRIRTPNNDFVTIPNALLLANKVINHSASIRDAKRPLLVHTTVTLGYDVPWRKVYAAFIDAARSTSYILKEPAPFVLQTGLDDFYVTYELKAYTNHPEMMAKIYSQLHENIQDKCNEVGIEIMSPHYSAIRDGNQTTIPENYLAKGYTAPGFRFHPLQQLFERPRDRGNEQKSLDG